MSVICVIQARMGSSRLPGKVLAEIGGRPALQLLLERVAPLAVETVVVATSVDPRDDPVVALARGHGIPSVRGSEADVLGRFADVLHAHPADTVVRLTADCPLTDPGIVAATLERHRERNADFTSNCLPRTYPKGLDVEVARADALREAAREARSPREREHVMPYLYRHPERYRLAVLRAPESLGALRWTVDTADDLDHVRALVARAGDPLASWERLLQVADRPVPSPGLRLRPATPSDAEILRAWRNDPDAVRFSRSGAAVGLAEHERWLESILWDPAHRLWIVEQHGLPAGQLRIDVSDATGWVSLAVDPGQRGRGVGRRALQLLVGELAHDPQVDRLRAEIHEQNRGSLRVFTGAGFTQVGTEGAFELFERPTGAGSDDDPAAPIAAGPADREPRGGA